MSNYVPPPNRSGEQWHYPRPIPAGLALGYRLLLKGEALGGNDLWFKSNGTGGGTWVKTKRKTVDPSKTYVTLRRLTPRTKRVPLGPEHFPPGTVIRHKDDTQHGYTYVLLVSGAGIETADDSFGYEDSYFQSDYQRKAPGCVWSPCYREIQE